MKNVCIGYMSSRPKTPKTQCFDGKHFYNPCCDSKKNQGCHFKKGINFSQMNKDYKTYKDIEKKMSASKEKVSSVSNSARTQKLRYLKEAREKWLNTYYKPECHLCDGNGINHNGYIEYLKKRILRRTQKTRNTHKTRTRRAPLRSEIKTRSQTQTQTRLQTRRKKGL